MRTTSIQGREVYFFGAAGEIAEYRTSLLLICPKQEGDTLEAAGTAPLFAFVFDGKLLLDKADITPCDISAGMIDWGAISDSETASNWTIWQ